MVNRVCEPASLVADAVATASTIAGNAPIAIRQAKRSMHHGLSLSLADGLLFEIEAYNRMVPTQDRREGVAAFAEKRKPRFQGC
jgi:enoyl-CoA hydratase/carnithine racemase